MSGQIATPIGSIALVATLFVSGVGVGVPTNIARADDCLTAPNSPPPRGSHWYYQTDRAKQRKCWFLRPLDQPTQQPAAQATSEAEPATPASAIEKPATASAGAPMSISANDIASSDEIVQQSAQEGSTAQSGPKAASTSSPAPRIGGVPTNTARADDCLTAPNSAAPEGSHWYYQTDRVTQRKCWHLRAPGQPTQPAVQATSEAAPIAHTGALEKSASASAGAPMSTSRSDSAPPWPSVKPQPAPMSSATTDEPIQQSAPAGNSAPSTPEASAPQAITSSQTNVQVAGLAPAAATISPDPSAVAPVKAQKPDLTPSDARDSLRPTVDAQASDDDAKSATRGEAPATTVGGMATYLTGTPVQIILIIALTLGLTGLLYRVVLKIVNVRRRKIIVDHPESDWIDDQNQHELRVDRQQHRSLDEHDELIDNLHPSRMQGASDHSTPRPFQADDDRQQRKSVDKWDELTAELHRSATPSTNVDSTHRPFQANDEWQQHRSSDERDELIEELHRSLMQGARL